MCSLNLVLFVVGGRYVLGGWFDEYVVDYGLVNWLGKVWYLLVLG